MADITLTSATVTWPIANQVNGAKAQGANGYVEFEASAVAVFHGGLTWLPSPQRAEVKDGEMVPIELPVNDPSVWNWKVTPHVGVNWPPFHVNVAKGGTDLSSAAVTPGTGPVRVLQGPQGGSVVGAEDQGDGTIRFVLDDGTRTAAMPITRGPAGPANRIAVGTVVKGEEPYASLVGEAPAQTLNLVLPKGDPGDPEELFDATPERRGLMAAQDKAHLDRTPTRDEVVARDSSKIIAGVGAAGTMAPSHDIGTDGTIVALGRDAMASMERVKRSIAIGRRALGTGTTSHDNIAIGDDALYRTSSVSEDYSQSTPDGTRNVAVGGNALRFNENGVAHVGVGRNAGQNIVGGTGVVAIGNGAHASRCPVGLSGSVENWAPLERGATEDVNVTAVGAWSLSRNIAADNTAFGSHSLRAATVSERNVAVGANSLRRLDENTWINGCPVTELDLSGTYSQSGKSLTISGVSGHGATVGDIVLLQLTSGPLATFQNDQPPAVVASVTPTAVTVTSPVSASGSGNAVLVARIGQAPATAHPYNTAVGGNTLSFLRSGGSNVALGFQAGLNIDGAQRNVALGTEALKGDTGADPIENTAVGHQALAGVQSGGNYNTAVGWRSGYNATTAKMSTFLGYGAGRTTPNGNPVTGVVNATAIGNDARASGDNQVQLGNSDTTTYVYGTVQNRSDVRDKADVRDTALGLGFIEKLRPVDYRWDMRDDYEGGHRDGSKKRARFHHGVIAQEVKEVVEATGVDFGGLQDHTVNGGDDVMSIGYDELIGPLIKAVQELSARLRDLEA